MTDRNVQFPARYRLTKVEGTDDIYDFEPVPGTITVYQLNYNGSFHHYIALLAAGE